MNREAKEHIRDKIPASGLMEAARQEALEAIYQCASSGEGNLLDKAVQAARLRATLGEQGERLGIDRIAAPAIDQAPTWMHRRSKWRPDATPAESSGGTGADAAGTP